MQKNRRPALVAVLLLLIGVVPPLLQRAESAALACSTPLATSAYAQGVDRALKSGPDLWGNELLHAPAGPTYERARRYLAPLLYAQSSQGKTLTSSGVYYLPFAQPDGPQGAGSVALHVADGSEILSQRADGPSLAVDVGGERFGACLAQLAPARLAAGWLPILETRYAGYAQESFSTRIAETRSLVSFVRVSGPGRIELVPSVRGLRRSGNRLVRGGRTYLLLGAGARWDGHALQFAGGTAYVAWLHSPSRLPELKLDAAAYDAARAGVERYWRDRLGEGATFDVPETRVRNAVRALLVQNLELTWRYSMGNPYEEFSFPESVDGAQVMAELGFAAPSRSMLRTSLARRPTPYPNWKMGEKLLGVAVYADLFDDGEFVAQVTPKLRGYVAELSRKLDSRNLLGRERYSSDIPDSVYGLHSQAIVWEGLRRMTAVWERAGQHQLAARATRLADRLEIGLRRAIQLSQRRLGDQSLFIPVRLLDREQPYDTVTESRSGSYWDLVAPYAFASGFFPPGSHEANGVLRYMLRHGTRLLGLVRAGAYALYGRNAPSPTSGTDQVYGINVARFLAAEDEPDQLVLSLYGQLAAGMTPNTFVSGEGATLTPLNGQRYRAMYLPPNSASNDAFLETLRVMLVQDEVDGLRLAYATPRDWLAPGRRIRATNVPTVFGPVSYELDAARGSVAVHVDVPSRTAPPAIRLRLRLPAGRSIRSVTPAYPVDRRTETIDLSRTTGPLDLTVKTS